MVSSTDVLSACDEILATPLNRIPEALFRTRYLPLFTGGRTEATFEEWVKVAGSAFQRVEVIDASGTLIFTVPPVLSSSDDYLEDLRRVGVMQQMQLAEQKAAAIPALGEAHIQRYLTDQVRVMKPDWETIQQWNAIFRRYGEVEIPTPDNPSPVQADVSETKPAQRDEFDDIFSSDIRN